MLGEHPSVFGVAAAALVLWPLSAVAAQPCLTHPLGQSRVAAIEDSRTIVLQDGRKVRLAGIEWAIPTDQARASLTELLLDRVVTLAGSDAPEPDRYGRIYAFPIVSGSETPIQYELLGRGTALVNGRIADKACTETLRAAERQARLQRRGAFAEGGAASHQAEDFGPILARAGQFAVVEGKVLSVREAGNSIYVNFGRRWSEDFTVTIAKRLQPDFISAGMRPQALTGKTVRIRGFVEERSGPWIEATSPGQFETAGR